MGFGYSGKILRVNLSTGRTSVDEQDERFYRTYMGGRCIGVYYLLKEVPVDTDPLGPDNKLIFAPSVITGAPIGGLSRHTTIALSPQTGLLGESHCGGFFGPELKFAGYDALIVEGQAKKPSYLWIDGGNVAIRDATHFWGKETKQVDLGIKEELGDKQIRVLQIGPAGERGVKYAAILNECRHANGRSGLGSVMGAKNLRAIAVRGDRANFKPYDPDAVRAIAKWFSDSYKSNPDQASLSELGTARYVAVQNDRGILPTRNFQDTKFEECQTVTGEAMRDTVLIDREGCYACPVRCKRVVKIDEPYEVDPYYGGPEYETLTAFGANCGVSDLAAVCKAHDLCNRYGMDTISTAGTIAFAMECYEKGVIGVEETDGLKLEWGNGGAMVDLVERIARREAGIGDLLSGGVASALAAWGDEARGFAMVVRNREFPMHDPRTKAMLRWSYAMAPSGACHVVCEHDDHFSTSATALGLSEGPGKDMDQSYTLGIFDRLDDTSMEPKKVRMFMYMSAVYSLYDTLNCCMIATAPSRTLTFDKLVETVQAVTGWETSLWELVKVGERAFNMGRAYTVKAGSDASDDVLPERMYETIPSGSFKGRRMTKEEFADSAQRVYRMANWDENGVPTRARLEELDLGWIADDLGL